MAVTGQQVGGFPEEHRDFVAAMLGAVVEHVGDGLPDEARAGRSAQAAPAGIGLRDGGELGR